MSKVFPELMCPFGQLDETKYQEAQKAGKVGRINQPENPEVIAGLVKAHYISVPMIATCCGVSACFTCIKDILADQLQKKAKNEPDSMAPPAEDEPVKQEPAEMEESEQVEGEDEDGEKEQQEAPAEEAKTSPQGQEDIEIQCPFCALVHRVKGSSNRSEVPFLVHNRQLDNLLEREIQKEFDSMTEMEKEQLLKKQAKDKIFLMTNELYHKRQI